MTSDGEIEKQEFIPRHAKKWLICSFYVTDKWLGKNVSILKSWKQSVGFFIL